MINFSKTNWLTVFLIIFIIVAGFFAYQWWQTKEELAKQIEENEVLKGKVNELQKEINKLQKQIEELKISKETGKETKDETADWKTYRNEKQGFEIKFPSEWNYFVSEDKIENDYGIFHAGFKGRGTEFSMQINMYGTPPFPSSSLCKKEREFTILKNTFRETLFSSFQAGINEEECDEFLLDEHLVHTRICIDEALKVYRPEAKQGVAGYYLSCNGGTLYEFILFCKGEKWQGKEGRDKCSELFDQILSSFRLIEK